MNCKYDDRIMNKLFCSNVSFEKALVVKEWKLSYLKKDGLVEGNVNLIYNWFIHDGQIIFLNEIGGENNNNFD